MSKLSHVIAAVNSRPWFVLEETLDAIHGIVQLHVEGGRLSREEIQARLEFAAAANGPRRGARVIGAVGVIPIYGLIMPRASMMTEVSGATSIEQIRGAFRQALEDEAVGSILFDIDSPGGAVDGIEELATEIREARGRKPMVSIACYTMASAALYLGAQADEVVASPSSKVGWVGTMYKHTEFSKANEMEGVTVTVIRNPAGKSVVNDVEPLSPEGKAELQQHVDDYTAQFHNAMAKGRGVPVSVVKAQFGGGGGMTAARAKAAGLVDRIESYDATLRRMASGRGPAPRTAATMGHSTTTTSTAVEINSRGEWAIAGTESPVGQALEESEASRSMAAEAQLALARARVGR